MIRGRRGCLRGEAGVRVAPREGLALATIIGGRDSTAQLDKALADLLGIAPPTRPTVARGRGGDLVWAGPGQWLLVSETRDIASQAATRLGGLAAVADQSAARAVLRLSGPRVRDALAKGCLLDLHPRAFRPGDAALTSIAHIGVHLWQSDDLPTYDVAVFRSMAGSFWSWLSTSADEYGCEVV
ncbi:MAG TPA: sarcosine oxidase subunit gamma family protein [Beijerinckiaceae bacterium]|nr:sarcosine oxidase subunit gamma family protein [Beijerinckiaceae bacterium]